MTTHPDLSMAEQFDHYAKLARTESVSRRWFLRGAASAAALGAASPLLRGGPASAAISGTAPASRHLMFGADAKTQMRVSWQKATSPSNPYLRYGTSASDLSQLVPAETRVVTTAAMSSTGTAANTQYYEHVALNNLAPDTTYYYVVGDDAYNGTAGAVSSFRTAPSSLAPFTFTAIGDQGVSSNAAADDAVISSQNPVFHLVAGDICYANNSGNGKITDSYSSSVWDDYFAQNESIASKIPWMVATGNHDMEAQYSPNGYGGQVQRFFFPGNGATGCQSTYWFRYGNLAVLSLDANDVSNEITANKGYSGGAQAAWVDSTLAALRADPTVDWIVCFFHHCAYATSTTHGSEGGVRTTFVPLFDKYGVDLVINGHNHQYERTDPIRAGAPTRKAHVGDSITPATDGTTYVCAGAGGKSLYSFPASGPQAYEGQSNQDTDYAVQGYYYAPGGKVNETVPWSRVRYLNYSVLAVDVVPAAIGQKTTLTFRAVSSATKGAEVDRLTMSRTAGAAAVSAPASLPESPLAVALPLVGIAAAVGAVGWARHRSGLEVPAPDRG